jgi:hypothetical protein
MRNLEELVKDNIEFINSMSCEKWIELLKSIAISILPFYGSDKNIEAIKNIKCISTHYNEHGLSEIQLTTSKLDYEDFKIKLNNVGIKMSQQRGHSNFEEYCFIPIEAFRIVNKEV